MASPVSYLDTRVVDVVGRKGTALGKLGIETVGDLLWHFPFRYADPGEVTAIRELVEGQDALVIADVVSLTQHEIPQRAMTIVTVTVTDGTDELPMKFFLAGKSRGYMKKMLSEQLLPGIRAVFMGQVSEFRGELQLTHPKHFLFSKKGFESDSEAALALERPIPIYHAGQGIATEQIQQLVGIALANVTGREIPDPVPESIRADRKLMPLVEAVLTAHRPDSIKAVRVAQHTLRFHEAFVLQAALLEQRAKARSEPATARVAGELRARFDAQLPFELTDDQQSVGREIDGDLAKPEPMNRLLQGEVGSGKTLVALRAMLAVAESSGQSALLAPTEVLAAQHMRSLVDALGPELARELHPVLITGKMSTKARREALLRAISGDSSIVVGTHALLTESTQFRDLGLVVIDEQHRFGVDQRDALRRKGNAPHVLVMTATPIPRTVAMTIFGDLDVSTIRQLPAGRAGIETHTVPTGRGPRWVDRVWERCAEEIRGGGQVFVVCPAITAKTPEADGADSPADGTTSPSARPLHSVEAMSVELRNRQELSGVTIDILHGQMSSEEKDAAMGRFASGETQLLIATTVIEVGVNVPNATTMVVMDADRFGISQLHQLRGRVGRGSKPGLCLLVSDADAEAESWERLEAVAATLDGFELADRDLTLRREGDMLSARQSGGRSSVRLVRVPHDTKLIENAREAAADVLGGARDYSAHPVLQDAIRRRLDEQRREYLERG